MDEKEARQRKIQARLDKYNAAIEELRAKAAMAGARARRKYVDQVQELQIRRDAMKLALLELSQAGSHSWTLFRQEMGEGFGRVKNAMEAARAELRGQHKCS